MRREKKDQILAVLPEKIRGILLNHGLDFEKIQEIRLREEQPLAVKKEGKEELFTHRVTKEELRETMEYVSNYSLYAYENELRQGFLTIEGGHRVGISGKIISEKEQIRNFQYITSINIRICHERYPRFVVTVAPLPPAQPLPVTFEACCGAVKTGERRN